VTRAATAGQRRHALVSETSSADYAGANPPYTLGLVERR
jgi:hypothetical protein